MNSISTTNTPNEIVNSTVAKPRCLCSFFLLKELSEKIATISPGQKTTYITDVAYNPANLDQMIEMAGELGVKIFVCEMSMDLMGFQREEMIDYPDLTYCGVAKFLEEAMGSKIQLFL